MTIPARRRSPLPAVLLPILLALAGAAVAGATAADEPSVAGSPEDRGQRLEVIQVGGNPHTDENLLLWLPEERILLEGDLFYYEEGARFPPSGRETMNPFFAGWLDKKGLSPRAIYGVHYRGAAGAEAIERARQAAAPAPPGR